MIIKFVYSNFIRRKIFLKHFHFIYLNQKIKTARVVILTNLTFSNPFSSLSFLFTVKPQKYIFFLFIAFSLYIDIKFFQPNITVVCKSSKLSLYFPCRTDKNEDKMLKMFICEMCCFILNQVNVWGKIVRKLRVFTILSQEK